MALAATDPTREPAVRPLLDCRRWKRRRRREAPDLRLRRHGGSGLGAALKRHRPRRDSLRQLRASRSRKFCAQPLSLFGGRRRSPILLHLCSDVPRSWGRPVLSVRVSNYANRGCRWAEFHTDRLSSWREKARARRVLRRATHAGGWETGARPSQLTISVDVVQPTR
jgi:hypothetical protein